MDSLSENPRVNEVFVIGGASLFDTALKQYPESTKLLFQTRINQVFECDVRMEPQNPEVFVPIFVSKTMVEKGITFDFMISGNKTLLEAQPELVPTRIMQQLKPHEEFQYLDQIRKCIESGNVKGDRTGTGVHSLFGT
jgi:hypothetical protein